MQHFPGILLVFFWNSPINSINSLSQLTNHAPGTIWTLFPRVNPKIMQAKVCCDPKTSEKKLIIRSPTSRQWAIMAILFQLESLQIQASMIIFASLLKYNLSLSSVMVRSGKILQLYKKLLHRDCIYFQDV